MELVYQQQSNDPKKNYGKQSRNKSLNITQSVKEAVDPYFLLLLSQFVISNSICRTCDLIRMKEISD